MTVNSAASTALMPSQGHLALASPQKHLVPCIASANPATIRRLSGAHEVASAGVYL